MNKMKAFLKVIVFAFFLIVIFDSAGYLLQDASRAYPKGKDARETDVAFIGSSHVYCNIIPQKIYDDHGFTCWDIAPSEPGIENTFYAVKEVNERIKPDVIVVELLMMAWDSATEEEYNFQTNLIHEMPLFSYNHLKGALDGSDKYKIDLEYYYNILRSHTNYEDLTRTDFLYWEGKDSKYTQLGYKSRRGNAVKVNEGEITYSDSDLPSEGYEPIASNKEYLEKILDYASEKDLNMFFVLTPDKRTEFYDCFKWTGNYIRSRGFQIYDFNTDAGKLLMSYDFNTDMADTNHLNDSGAIKLTDTIGRILSENYELKDHREDNGYKAWNKHRYNYLYRMKAAMLDDVDSIEQYISIAADLGNDFITIMAAAPDSDALAEYGINAGELLLINGDHISSGTSLEENIEGYPIISDCQEGINIKIDNNVIYDGDEKAAIIVFDILNDKVTDKILIKDTGDFKR